MLLQTSEMIRLNNTQYSHFLQHADALRHSGSFCDAVISVESQTFRAHRLVLACTSRRLAKQLTQGDADIPLHCALDLISPHTFQQVLDFAYTQTLEVPVEDLRLLLRAAQLLEMQHLEDQCRTQLGALDCRSTETPETEKDAAQSAEEEVHQKKEGCDVLGKEHQKTSSHKEETQKNTPPSDTVEGHGGPPSPSRKRKVSHTPSTRDSVITSPYSSQYSLSSPWVFPKNKWHSVNTLRQMTQSYTSLKSAHFQPHQQVLAYPFSLAAPHMYPLLASSLPSQFHSVVADYSGISAYAQHPLAGAPQLGDVAKQGLLKRKPSSQKPLVGASRTGEGRYNEGHRDTTQRVPDCRHCSPSHLANTIAQESTSRSAGEACGGWQPYKRGQRADGPHHGVGKPYQCTLCLKKFSLKHQLDTHLRVHTGEKPFECRLCGQRSRDYSAMIKHLRTHGGATPYQCTVCLEFCSSLVTMQRHIKSHPVQDFPPDWSISKTYLYASHI